MILQKITKPESGFIMPIGKTLDEVPEIIVSSIKDHLIVPGVKIIEYKIPLVDAQLKTIGLRGSSATENFIKSVYDPLIWTDAKIEKALKESLQDYSNKNNGQLVNDKFISGRSKDGYEIEFILRNDNLKTFYFK
jgi:hypothetical protein